MGKEDFRLIDNINYFSKLLDKNFKNILQERNLITENMDKEKRKEFVGKTKEELLILSEIWKKISHIRHKRKSDKPRKNTKELNQEKEKRNIVKNQVLKDRNFMLIKKYIKLMCSDEKKQSPIEIQLGEVIFMLRKYLDDKVTILFPKVDTILKYIPEKIEQSENIYSKIVNRIPFEISLVHLLTGTVINLNMDIEQNNSIVEQVKNLTVKVKLKNFNFHYLYENHRNISPLEMSEKYKLKNFNSNENLELLDKRFKECSSISINLKSSEFDFYNQMTLGMRKRIEDYNYMTVDSKSFFTKFLIFCTRYLKLGLKVKNVFCHECKKFFFINLETKKVEYPVINLQKEFYHFQCSKNIDK